MRYATAFLGYAVALVSLVHEGQTWELPGEAINLIELTVQRVAIEILAATIPNCVSWDPTFAYEVATIIQDGLRRMITEQEDVFYYLTLMNENYPHPAMPEGSSAGILKGMYRFREGPKSKKGGLRVQLLGSGTIFREVVAAAGMLKEDWGVDADLWSCTSFT